MDGKMVKNFGASLVRVFAEKTCFFCISNLFEKYAPNTHQPFTRQQKNRTNLVFMRILERGMGGNRTHGEAFAEPCLTTWLPRLDF